VRQQVITLVRSTYAGINHQHLSELLAEREGLVLSRPTLRRILLGAGLPSHRQRRPPRHRRRRQRYAQEGMLLQLDGSKHRWLGDGLPWLTLLAAIDDATGKVVGALFRAEEDAQGYFLLLQGIVSRYGRPWPSTTTATASSSATTRNPGPWPSSWRAGVSPPNAGGSCRNWVSSRCVPTHLRPRPCGKAVRHAARAPGAELRLAGITNLPAANRLLPGFVARYNRQFAVEAAEPGLAYRALPVDWQVAEVFCFKHERVVAKDNTVRFGGVRLQIGADKQRRSYAHAKVAVHERMDGRVAVYHEGHCLVTSEAPAETPVLRMDQRKARGAGSSDQPESAVEATPAGSNHPRGQDQASQGQTIPGAQHSTDQG